MTDYQIITGRELWNASTPTDQGMADGWLVVHDNEIINYDMRKALSTLPPEEQWEQSDTVAKWLSVMYASMEEAELALASYLLVMNGC